MVEEAQRMAELAARAAQAVGIGIGIGPRRGYT
jgi:hypothetical protein